MEMNYASVFPLRHRPCVIARQQATAHRGGGVEHAVDDDAVKVQVGIEGGTEAVNERDRAEAGREARVRAVRTQVFSTTRRNTRRAAP